MAPPRKFWLVELLAPRTRRGGDRFYRTAVLEQGCDKVKDLYCKAEYAEVIKTLEKVGQGVVHWQTL